MPRGIFGFSRSQWSARIAANTCLGFLLFPKTASLCLRLFSVGSMLFLMLFIMFATLPSFCSHAHTASACIWLWCCCSTLIRALSTVFACICLWSSACLQSKLQTRSWMAPAWGASRRTLLCGNGLRKFSANRSRAPCTSYDCSCSFGSAWVFCWFPWTCMALTSCYRWIVHFGLL